MSHRGVFAGGFTLVELMTALSVAAVWVVLAAPALRDLIGGQRLTLSTHALVGSLSYARSEAIRRSTQVTVCPSVNESTCDAGSAWNRGWIVFVDLDGDGQASEGETVLRVSGKQSDEIATGGSSLSSVSYGPDGKARKPSGAWQFGSIYLCGAQRSKRIVLSASGRVRQEHAQCLQ